MLAEQLIDWFSHEYQKDIEQNNKFLVCGIKIIIRRNLEIAIIIN
jgi:hypothetical protein